DRSVRTELNELYEKEGLTAIQKQLRELDPAYFETVDINNPQRILRALEVCIGSGKPYSGFRNRKASPRPFNIVKIALGRDREELYDRIDYRMDQMIAQGLFEEARALFDFRQYNALQTVGYREIFGYLEGKYDK